MDCNFIEHALTLHIIRLEPEVDIIEVKLVESSSEDLEDEKGS